MAFAGGASSSGATPSESSPSAGAFAETRSQRRSTISAGYGACPASTLSSAARTGAMASASSGVSP